MSISKPHISVLFVDDEQSNLKGLRANFRRDFTTYIANSGDEALELLEQHEVHVIVSDQRMPNMTGVEFFAKVREKYPLIVRILLTGYTEVGDIIKAINDGHIFGFMGKPYDPIELMARIEQAYDHYRLRAEKETLLQRYHDVFRSSGDPIVVLNERCEVLDANPATEKLVEQTADQLRQHGCLRLLTEPKKLVSMINTRKEHGKFPRMDVSLITPGGRTIDCLLTLTYTGQGEDGTGQYQAMLMDITDRKEKQEQLQKAKEELEQRVAERTTELQQALQDLEAFSYTVAHDLRSPLKNIQALNDHLNGNVGRPDDEEIRSLTGLIQRGSSRMLDLIDDLLRFARSDHDAIALSEVDLNDTISDLQSELIPADRTDRIEFTSDALPTVVSDPSLLRVALTNLLSNSIKFTRNEPMARIHVGSLPSEGSDVIFVQDNGAGFDPQQQEQVFKAFKRLHRNDQFEGTGIGLSTVHRIMEKLDGEVWAESSVGEGTAIYLRIPHRTTGSAQVAPARKVA